MSVEHMNLHRKIQEHEVVLGVCFNAADGTSDTLSSWKHFLQGIQSDIAGGEHQMETLVINRSLQLSKDIRKKIKVMWLTRIIGAKLSN
jgi:uncharacterized protein YoxC